MRPDQHKKIKNAKYKKKHGMQEKASLSHVDHTEKKHSTCSEKSNLKSQDYSTGTDLENKSDHNTQPNSGSGFSKRPIESNWEKYQCIDDEDQELGADFNVLLSFAGDSSAHMKLKDEEDWDSQQEFSFMMINHKHIANELEDIPFGEKYKISEFDLDPTLVKFVSSLTDWNGSSETNLLPSNTLLSSEETQELGFNFSRVDAKPVMLASKSDQMATLLPTNEQTNSIFNKTAEPTNSQTSAISSGNADNVEEKVPNLQDQNLYPNDTFEADNDIITALLHGSNTLHTESLSPTGQQNTTHDTTEMISTESSNLQQSTINGDGNENKDVDDLEDWLDSIL